jgi:hypothetical protein
VRAGAPLRARAAPDIELEAEESSVVALLGGSARKGSWEPPARLRVLAVMGGVELDFREADLYEGETFVDVLAIMGGVSIIVPPDIDVDADGQGFLGGTRRGRRRSPAADRRHGRHGRRRDQGEEAAPPPSNLIQPS